MTHVATVTALVSDAEARIAPGSQTSLYSDYTLWRERATEVTEGDVAYWRAAYAEFERSGDVDSALDAGEQALLS